MNCLFLSATWVWETSLLKHCLMKAKICWGETLFVSDVLLSLRVLERIAVLWDRIGQAK